MILLKCFEDKSKLIKKKSQWLGLGNLHSQQLKVWNELKIIYKS